MDLDPATLRRDAVRALADVLRAPDAKPADVLRAAELVLRETPSAPPVGGSQVSSLDDAALLALARGDTPREKGPAVPAADSVPSHTPTPHLPTPTVNWGSEGPKTDPPKVIAPGGGPKKDPRISVLFAGGPKTDPLDATPPPVHIPDPWE